MTEDRQSDGRLKNYPVRRFIDFKPDDRTPSSIRIWRPRNNQMMAEDIDYAISREPRRSLAYKSFQVNRFLI